MKDFNQNKGRDDDQYREILQGGVTHEKKPDGVLQGLMRFLGEAMDLGGKVVKVLGEIDSKSDDYNFFMEKAYEVDGQVSYFQAQLAKEALKSPKNLEYYSKNIGKLDKHKYQSYSDPINSILSKVIDDASNGDIPRNSVRNSYNNLAAQATNPAGSNSSRKIIDKLRNSQSSFLPPETEASINPQDFYGERDRLRNLNDYNKIQAQLNQTPPQPSGNGLKPFGADYSNSYEQYIKDKSRINAAETNSAFLNNQLILNQIINERLNQIEDASRRQARPYSRNRSQYIQPRKLDFKFDIDNNNFASKMLKQIREYHDKVLKEAFGSEKNTLLIPENEKEYRGKLDEEILKSYYESQLIHPPNSENLWGYLAASRAIVKLKNIFLSSTSTDLAKNQRGLEQTDNLMQKSIYNLEDKKEEEVNLKFNIDNQEIIRNLKIPNFLAEKMTKDMKGIVFSPKSKLSQMVKNSSKFKTIIKKLYNGETVKSTNFEQEDSRDLFASLHNVTILDSKKTIDSGFKVILCDVYDFEEIKEEEKGSELTQMDKFNNAAFELQENGFIKNYYIILPIEFSKEDVNETLK